jgi:hypothetical protein
MWEKHVKKFLFAASAAVAAMTVATTANAAQFAVMTGDPLQVIPTTNDYKGQLAGLGLTNEIASADLVLSGQAWVQFTFLGSESYFSESFFVNGNQVFTENTDFTNWNTGGTSAPIALTDFLSAMFTSNVGAPATPGTIGLAVFTDANGNYNQQDIYFGYDDGGAGPDRDYDDMIVEATILPIPEPATWALMVAGIAAVGVSMRRRTQNVMVSFS